MIAVQRRAFRLAILLSGAPRTAGRTCKFEPSSRTPAISSERRRNTPSSNRPAAVQAFVVDAPQAQSCLRVVTCASSRCTEGQYRHRCCIGISLRAPQRRVRQGLSEAVNPSNEVVGLVFDELLVDPAPAIVPAPYLSPQQPARDRAPRHHNRPEVPGVRPRPLGTERGDLKQIIAAHCTELRH
jgi:hypothetical protein